MYSTLYKHITFLRNPKFAKEYRFHQKDQWYRREEILDIQRRRLKALLKHAYQNVPYYHALFKDRNLRPDEIETIDDLQKLPVLTKDDIRKNFKSMVTRNIPRTNVRLYSTGGSTGEPLRFYITEEYLNAKSAAELRAYGWCGYELGDKHALIWGSPLDLRELKKLRGRIEDRFARRIWLNSFEMSTERMRIFARRLQRFKPKTIRGYASAVYLFAAFLLHEEITDIKPKGVITAAETLFDHERREIEEAFGCEVYDFYGSREAAAISCECSEHFGYHVSAEDYVLECVKDGEQTVPGETGVILVTNLRNSAMPFIRYEIGDLGTLSDATCPCGRGLPLMRSIEGRVTDVLVTCDGNFVSAPVLTLIFKDLPVKQYQIAQETKERITVRIVKGTGYSRKDTDYIIRAMHHYVGKDIQVNMKFLHSIPTTRSGKRRPVISNVPIRF